jgi:hypothetical protein
MMARRGSWAKAVLVILVLVLAPGAGHDHKAAVVTFAGSCNRTADGHTHDQLSRHVLVTVGLVHVLLQRYAAVYVHLSEYDRRAIVLLHRIHAGSPVHPLHLASARHAAFTQSQADHLREVAAGLFDGHVEVVALPDLGSDVNSQYNRAWAGMLLEMGLTEQESMYVSARVPLARMWTGLYEASSVWRREEVDTLTPRDAAMLGIRNECARKAVRCYLVDSTHACV